jgi:hypothetical protein
LVFRVNGSAVRPALQVEDSVMGEFKNQDKDAGEFETRISDGKPAFSQIGDKEQQGEPAEDEHQQFDEGENLDFQKGEIQGNDMGKPGADDGAQSRKEHAAYVEAGDTDDLRGQQADPGGEG